MDVCLYVCGSLPNCSHFNDAESSAMNALVNLRLNFCVGYLLIKLGAYIHMYVCGMEFVCYAHMCVDL